MLLARAAPDAGTTAALKRACAEWNAALADGPHESRQKRRKLCTDQGIQASRDVDKNAEAAARWIPWRAHPWKAPPLVYDLADAVGLRRLLVYDVPVKAPPPHVAAYRWQLLREGPPPVKAPPGYTGHE